MTPSDQQLACAPCAARHRVQRAGRCGFAAHRARVRVGLGAAVLMLASALSGAGASAASTRSHSASASGGQTTDFGESPLPYLLGLPLTSAQILRGAPAGVDLFPPNPVRVSAPALATEAVIARVAGTGIPKIALTAYHFAATRMATDEPACGIGWPILAALGRVETNHGQLGGSVLFANGTSTHHIIGIALDGTGLAYVGDTDSGRLDGDRVFDHAIGPMQFLPATWAAFQSDGDADLIADPFNIYDAALTAARYLCAAGSDLRTTSGQSVAVLAYNGSDQYVAQVLALADVYAHAVPAGSLPITGPISGALPPAAPGSDLPVDPAAPPVTAPDANLRLGNPAPTPTLATTPGGAVGRTGTEPPFRSGAGSGSAPTGSRTSTPSAPPSSPRSSNTPPPLTSSPGPTTPPLSTTPAPAPSSTAPPASTEPPSSTPSDPATGSASPLPILGQVLCAIDLLGVAFCPA